MRSEERTRSNRRRTDLSRKEVRLEANLVRRSTSLRCVSQRSLSDRLPKIRVPHPEVCAHA